MHLILTHEQADFDALASLFGGSLILRDALPVLPRRMNRNALSFVTLYGADFPFLDPRDQPQGAIESITLVDTQSLITLKGMSERTQIRVFDHHQPRSHQKTANDKNPTGNWDVTTIESGATTTYFVERMQERDETLSIIQATLLLLGIYEDTGSLTYASTTSRDVRAVAWLMEQGASLRIAAEFLNPPLSAGQREIYDRLVASAETIDLNGHRVVLTCGQVTDYHEEISTLAHKLRELFETDALFVLVRTDEGVRLVARSTSDDIDVAAIASHFGGGGHDRAAAALIKKETLVSGSARSLERIRVELLSLLPRHIRPSITVAQLMSKRPRILAPDTSVEEAAKLMQRYGYEGFPVVDNGKVIGLLTRRAVDRAIGHKLNLPASSLMEAGEIVVHLHDSLQVLQARMIESGWGQIPVIDENYKIVGIVTRTDLLKVVSRGLPHLAKQRNLAHKLKKSLPPDHLAIIQKISDEAMALHMPVYIVGGFVRDLLLEHPGLDFDIVVEGDAIVLANSLVEKYGGHITAHSRFGTAKWFMSPAKTEDNLSPKADQTLFIDLISSRQEFYEHPSALPTVEHGNIKFDLQRRDFTINTLALRLDGKHFGELHDYFGGFADLEHKYVRVLHSLSFVDDATRMVRAVRYEQRYGFAIEPRTAQLIEEACPLISRLSSERIRHELDLILDELRALEMLNRLNELGLLSSICDVLPWNLTLQKQIAAALNQPFPEEWDLKSPVSGMPLKRALTYILWLGSLPKASIEIIQARLCFPVGFYKALLTASQLSIDFPQMRGQAPSFYVEKLDNASILVVYALYLMTGDKALEEYALKWRHIHPHTTGDTLLALGLKPGPGFQHILRVLRDARVDGILTNDAEETALLNQLIATENL